ncbi:hypothetical protein CR513_21616, partial [Mucuna pruriens]
MIGWHTKTTFVQACFQGKFNHYYVQMNKKCMMSIFATLNEKLGNYKGNNIMSKFQKRLNRKIEHNEN